MDALTLETIRSNESRVGGWRTLFSNGQTGRACQWNHFAQCVLHVAIDANNIVVSVLRWLQRVTNAMTPDTDPDGIDRNDMPITRLACAETWTGNSRTAGLIELPGLVAWVHSAPAGSDGAGGDVHYVSVCPSCIVSRVALADVSGHGQAVVALAEKLCETHAATPSRTGAGLVDAGSQSGCANRTRRRPLRHDGGGGMARAQGSPGFDERRASAPSLVPCGTRRVELA